MPTQEHEFPIQLFRNRPELAAQLLDEVFGLELPSYTSARIESGDLTQCEPTEYRADAVVTLSAPDPALAVVVEVQRGYDKDKRLSWPLYLAALRARHDCPTVLLVLCPDQTIARWCARPIHMGHPDWVLKPLVLGPERMPVPASAEEAAAAPELAVLSAIAHGEDTDVLDTFVDAMNLIEGDNAQLYADYVIAALPEAARKYLENLMVTGTYKYQSDFARRYVAEGEAKGRAEDILVILSARGVAIPDEVRERITACTDLEQLSAWVRRAATAETTDELFD